MLRVLLSAAAVSLAATSSAQVPHTFAAGAPAKAAEVNANFTYLDGRVTAVATELASGVTVSNTALNPVPITGAITVENSPASPVPVTGGVTVSNTPATPVPVAGTVTVGNTGASPVPVAVTNGSGSPVPVTVSNASSISTYVSNGAGSPVPVSQIGSVSVMATSPLPVSVRTLPGLIAISVHFDGSNTSWIGANIGIPNYPAVVVETVTVRCPYAASVEMVGIGASSSAFPGGASVTPIDAASMRVSAASINAVWPTTTLAGTSILPPTSANLPVGNSFSFWVGNGATSAAIDCIGTVIIRPANSGF
jgi:hypothetical protein